MSQEPLITNSRHPCYHLIDYRKFRLVQKGGREFIEEYLERYDTRESAKDFLRRKRLSHNPGYAAQALAEIFSGIVQRMPEITRSGGTDSYNRAIGGLDGGVDLENNDMNTFIAQKVLPELGSMGKMGVYVDMPAFNPYSTLAEFQTQPHPYLYFYQACDILNWQNFCWDNEIRLRSILLREKHWELNAAGLPQQEKELFRLCRLVKDGVIVQFYEQYTEDRTRIVKERVIKEFFLEGLTRIPFVFYDIGRSLYNDSADIQVGLLNLASADLSYAINSNFPFYVEGYDSKTANTFGKDGPQTKLDEDGEELEKTGASADASPEIVVGTMHGRLYPFEAPPPAFIHPSPEPLRVSMEKQEQMKTDIRRLLNLAVANVSASRQSADAKAEDKSGGLESGLAAIGIELQGAEREIALIWSQYEKTDITKKLVVAYPTTYSLKTDDQRIAEAKALGEIQGAAPSKTFQKEVAKLAARAVLNGKISKDNWQKIEKEIDAAKYVTGDWQSIKSDFELGIVDPETAAEARGYDPALVEKAQEARVKRMAETAIAQSVGGGSGAAGQSAARGGEGGGNAKDEKTTSQDSDNNPNGGKAVRGKADG